MTRTRLVAALVAAFSCLLPTAAIALSGSEQLQRFLDGLRTMEARFEQSVLNASHTEALRSQGVFYLQRPGRFRWDYHEPFAQQIIADGSRVWMYEPDLDQVSHQNQDTALRGTPALLLSDTAPLERHFQIIDLGSKNSFDWVELIPLDKDSEFVRVLLAFTSDQLRRMEMADNFGQVSRFEFIDVKRNPVLDPALFIYIPRPGIDVIGE